MSESSNADHNSAVNTDAGAPGTNQRKPDAQNWEQGVLRGLVEETLREKRVARRWGVFFKFCMLAYGILLLVLYAPRDLSLFEPSVTEHTALVEINGVIAQGAQGDADKVAQALRAAFKAEEAKAVVLSINSPGGSPVQAGLIADEIKRLRKLNPDKPLYAVLGDICASGGYYIAAVADRIFADKATLVGSIGVISKSFGFTDLMREVGVERRVMAAGENKALLDPFLPLDEAQKAHMEDLLKEVHEQFISVVQTGRGDKLAQDPNLYSGLIWTGERAIELGLVDALSSVGKVARETVEAEKIIDYTVKPSLLQSIINRFSISISEQLWQRSAVSVEALRP